MVSLQHLIRNPIYTHVARKDGFPLWQPFVFIVVAAASAFTDQRICEAFHHQAIYHIMRSGLSLRCADSWTDLAFSSGTVARSLAVMALIAAVTTAFITAHQISQSHYNLIRVLPLSHRRVVNGYLLAGLRRILPIVILAAAWSLYIVANIASRGIPLRWLFSINLGLVSGFAMLAFGLQSGLFMAFVTRNIHRAVFFTILTVLPITALIHIGGSWRSFYFMVTGEFAWIQLGSMYSNVRDTIPYVMAAVPLALTLLMVGLLYMKRINRLHTV